MYLGEFMTSNDSIPLAQKILNAIIQTPGMTGGDIAKVIYGPSGVQPKINTYLHKLMSKGKITRQEGQGGYRYFATSHGQAKTDVKTATSVTRPAWFVGATWDGKDQLDRFISQGIWQNGYEDRLLDVVRSMQVGDKIAIKASFTKKHNLPFDNKGKTISVMSIKAVGEITENSNDGRTVTVRWEPHSPAREWYIFTSRTTIWEVRPEGWARQALIDFAFNGIEQPIEQFLQEDNPNMFEWTQFYESLAIRLLDFKKNRKALLDIIYSKIEGVDYLSDRFIDGSRGQLQDICPFTVFGIFNRGITNERRTRIANQLKTELNLDPPAPTHFDGIPVLNNQNSWFFGYADVRQPEDIDILWEVFEQAITFESTGLNSSQFEQAYQAAKGVNGVAWTLTIGLYWIRPWSYLTLDGKSRVYISNKLGIQLPKSPPDAHEYIALVDGLLAEFCKNDCPAHSFPELSRAAWLAQESELIAPQVVQKSEESISEEAQSYSLQNILQDGCFLPEDELERYFDRLKSKQNLILQGPPGTGKTWLARRLGFALLGSKRASRIRAMQFHPNLSYEDFVRGWRPSGDGKLSLTEGPFMEAVSQAQADPSTPFIIVIEEINRGNPAQIFGEMLTLLEADKRRPEEALELCYKRFDGETIYLPSNLFIIGTMNIADRSLAIVDFALRRRFAFVDLQPQVGSTWRNWVVSNNGIEDSFAKLIESRMYDLNELIRNDQTLGPAFRIGHSYVTPKRDEQITDQAAWFRQVVSTEIGPLLDEYWFDDLTKSSGAQAMLCDGM